MGMFDDLVPRGTTASSGVPSGGGMFDDLVPKGPVTPSDPYADIATPLAAQPGTAIADPYSDIAAPAAPSFDWSNVKTAADVQKVLDEQPTKEAKQAALRDWAKFQAQKESDAGLKPQLNPSNYVFGTGLINMLDAAGNAAVAAATGGKHGNTYEQERALQDARHDLAWENASLPSKVGSVAGGIVADARLPMMKLFPEAGVIGRTANAATTGATFGGIEGGSRAATPEEIGPDALSGAATGILVGGIANPVAEGIGNVVRTAAKAVRPLPADLSGMSRGAVQRVARAINDDEVAANYPQLSQQLGPEGMLADMGPNLRDQAGAIANRPGAGQRTLRTALNYRNAGADARMTGDIDAAFGAAPNLVRLEQNTVDAANTAATPHYDDFYNLQIPVTGPIQRVMDRMEAMPQLRRDAEELAGLEGHTIGHPVPTPREYDYYHRAINDRVEQVGGEGTELGRALMQLDRQLREAVDNAISPGNPAASPWARARAFAANGKQFQQGLREGSNIFSNPKTHHPDQVEYDLYNATPAYGEGYRAGARADLDNMARDSSTQFGPSGDRAVRKGMWSPNAERKVNQLASSPDTARQVLNRRDAESTFAETRNEVLSNSATARRQAAAKEFPAPLERDVIGRFNETPVGLLIGAGRSVLNAATLGRYNEHLARMAENAARIISATGMDRDRYFSSLQNYIRSQGIAERKARAITDAVRRLSLASVPVAAKITAGSP